jgi:hypothetical protein
MRRVSAMVVVSMLVAVMTGGTAPAQSTAPKPLPAGKSTWKNQRNSMLSIDVVASGAFTGTFTTADPKACKDGTPWPVTGTTNGNTVAFTVNFQKDCPSVGVWNGHHVFRGSAEQIETLWLLALAQAQDPPSFEAIVTGSDVFVRQP